MRERGERKRERERLDGISKVREMGVRG